MFKNLMKRAPELIMFLLTVSICLQSWILRDCKEKIVSQHETINQLVEANNQLTAVVNELTVRITK